MRNKPDFKYLENVARNFIQELDFYTLLAGADFRDGASYFDKFGTKVMDIVNAQRFPQNMGLIVSLGTAPESSDGTSVSVRRQHTSLHEIGCFKRLNSQYDGYHALVVLASGVILAAMKDVADSQTGTKKRQVKFVEPFPVTGQ